MTTPTRRMRLDVCARAPSGHVIAKPTIVFTKSRRRITFSKALDRADYPSQRILHQGFGSDEIGFRGSVWHGSNPEPLMSALGHVWTAPWQVLSDAAAALVGCGHVSGLLMRRMCRWP